VVLFSAGFFTGSRRRGGGGLEREEDGLGFGGLLVLLIKEGGGPEDEVGWRRGAQEHAIARYVLLCRRGKVGDDGDLTPLRERWVGLAWWAAEVLG
jgi:hypothetical protein